MGHWRFVLAAWLSKTRGLVSSGEPGSAIEVSDMSRVSGTGSAQRGPVTDGKKAEPLAMAVSRYPKPQRYITSSR